MKTKNILKIGVFSIVILALLISPILKSNVPEAEANGEQVVLLIDTRQIHIPVKETPSEDLCVGVGGVDTNGPWPDILTKNWWEHTACVLQKGIIEGLGKMFAAMINTQVKMIIWAFDPATYGGFVKNSAVQEVWKFIRDLINLVLVLALVFIAITTILGMKKYSWQQTLWKLVVVALLVNFSLVMAGMILDVSHFLAYTFLNLSKMNSASIADSMIESFEVETLNSEKAYELSGVTSVTKATTTGWGLGWGNFFIASFGLIIIGLFALIALLAVFIAMIVRSFIIVALLCVTPVAFAAWIFPDTEKYWKMWWDQFIKWCTFPIIFGVMLWIGVSVVDNLGIGSNADLGMIPFIIRMFLFSMFLVGGLIFSIQGGGAVAQTVTKQAGKLGLAAGAFVGTKIKGKMVESPTYKKAGQALTKVPLLKGVGEEMMVAGEKAKATRVKEHEKNLENVSLGSLKQLEKTPLPSPLDRNAYERKVALTNKLADTGEMGKESIEFTKMNKGDIRFKKEAIAQAVPHHFKIDEKGQLIETGKSIKERVEALARIKPDKIRDKTQDSDFIKDIVKEKVDEARKQGKSEQEIKDAGNKAFDETIQGIFKTLSPAQSAGFYQGLSPKDLIEGLSPKDLIEGKWGGPEGKIVQAINKDEQTKKRFYEELLPLSSALRASSGIKAEKEQKQDKGPKETPTSPPPGPGWVFKNGLWRKE